jgi:hypothetical protein
MNSGPGGYCHGEKSKAKSLMQEYICVFKFNGFTSMPSLNPKVPNIWTTIGRTLVGQSPMAAALQVAITYFRNRVDKHIVE